MSTLNYVQNSTLETDEELNTFLMTWDKDYENRAKSIGIFNSALTQHWTKAQQAYFAKVFYHARGHFHDFLWYLGNHTDRKIVKDMVLKNIAEEMNGSARSHEQLYEDFAECVGANLEREYVEEETYLDCIKEFNKGHLKWLQSHNDDSRISAFSAYERLDNLDYVALLGLVRSLKVPPQGQLFYKIHTRVQHFETTADELKLIWNNNPQTVKNSFNFIGQHQIKMWNDLSESVFSFATRDSE